MIPFPQKPFTYILQPSNDLEKKKLGLNKIQSIRIELCVNYSSCTEHRYPLYLMTEAHCICTSISDGYASEDHKHLQEMNSVYERISHCRFDGVAANYYKHPLTREVQLR